MTKVLNIAGCGRSGSTILGNALGQATGFLHVGELCSIWQQGFRRNVTCGCGAAFRECALWKEVLRHPLLRDAERDAPLLAPLPRRVSHALPLLMAFPAIVRRRRGLSRYLDATGNLLRAIQQVSGCRVIVDSSKVPAHNFLLSLVPGVDVSYVHLVRDPRAVAHSWKRTLVRFDGANGAPSDNARTTAGRAALKWIRANATMEAIRLRTGRVLYCHYEQFVRDPAATVERIARFAGREAEGLSFADERTIVLAPTHTVWGNYSRLRTGPVEIRPDEEWKSKMGRADRLLVTALTRPLMARYDPARSEGAAAGAHVPPRDARGGRTRRTAPAEAAMPPDPLVSAGRTED